MARPKRQIKNSGSNYGTLRKYGLAGGQGNGTNYRRGGKASRGGAKSRG